MDGVSAWRQTIWSGRSRRKSMVRGALHIHSTYSDGEYTLAELRAELRALGCRFAFVTDHADWLDEERVRSYRDECASLSDADFLFIPSLEYPCAGRMHILGYGVASLIGSDQPETVIAEIRRLGGLSVVAHPRSEAFDTIERFQPLPDGIEVWNTKYDGQYAPRPATFELLRRMRARDPVVRAFYGLDLHWRKQYRHLFVDVEAEGLTPDALLTALSQGAYHGTKDGLRLPSSGAIAEDLLARFARINRRSGQMRGWIGHVKQVIDRSGVPFPASLKAQLRRIF